MQTDGAPRSSVARARRGPTGRNHRLVLRPAPDAPQEEPPYRRSAINDARRRLARMSTYTAHVQGQERNVGLKLFALFAGITIPIVMLAGLFLALSAFDARDEARSAAAKVDRVARHQAAAPTAGSGANPSYAGVAPANAGAIAMAHPAVSAELPAAPAGDVAAVRLDVAHRTVSIAPGIRYEAWTFGSTVPGPVIHVRQGQLVKVTLRNTSDMPHSVDFHAAQVSPNIAFADVQPGATKTFSFRADVPGVFMYHCGTAPAFVHIANGMYGAIVVEPKGLPVADRQYVLVSSEFYLSTPG